MNFHAQTDITIVGSDPEMADMDNPRGYIYGFAAYVVATNERGDRWMNFVRTDRSESVALAPAERMAAALNTRLANLGKMPVDFARWTPTRPAYGSEAWQEYGEAEEIALERREADDEIYA